MSNGDPYHRDSMTCAHLKYPLGTYLCVRNPKNGKEVVVKVTDRGPHTKRFAIDLSLAAARELDIIHKGFAMVEITPCPEDKVPYRSGKTEYDFLQPKFDPTLPVRTWNHPEWNEQEDAEPEASEEEVSKEANAEKTTEETRGKDGSHEKPCGLCVDFCQSEQEKLSIYDATQQSPELFHFCIKGFSRCICRPIDKVVKDFILSVIHSCRYIIEGFIPKFSYFAIP